MSWLTEILVTAWGILGHMAPYLLFGFFVAGLLSVVISPDTVERHLGRGRLGPVFKASALGVPLPLCSCGVIPVAQGLKNHGASRGATTSFLISTPQTGVDSIFVTYSLLGWLMALYRPLTAFVSGLFGGSMVEYLDGETVNDKQIRERLTSSSNSTILEGIRYGFVNLPRDIALPLLGGLIAAAIITAAIPAGFLESNLGTGLFPKLVMLVFGIPLYVCSTSSIPVAAALIGSGVSPGTALVFLMSGPATNAATITTVWKVLGAKSSIIYLASVAISAIGAGAALDALAPHMPTGAIEVCLHSTHTTGASVAAVILIIILVSASIRKEDGGETCCETSDYNYILSIEGMTCDHCKASVERSLRSVPRVTDVTVDRVQGRAYVSGDGIVPDELMQAVTAAGYTARIIENDPTSP